MHNPENVCSLAMFVGAFNSSIASVICGAIARHLERIPCPRESTILMKKRRFFKLSVTSALLRKVSTVRTWQMFFSRDLEKNSISSRYLRASRQFCCEEYDVHRALECSKGVAKPKRHTDELGKSVVGGESSLCLSDSSSLACRYLLLQFIVKENAASPRESMHSSIRGVRYKHRLLTALSLQ